MYKYNINSDNAVTSMTLWQMPENIEIYHRTIVIADGTNFFELDFYLSHLAVLLCNAAVFEFIKR